MILFYYVISWGIVGGGGGLYLGGKSRGAPISV